MKLCNDNGMRAMTGQATQDHVRDWLGSSQAIALLHQTSRSVFRYLSIYHIHPPFFNPRHSSEDIIEEIRSELALFILDAVQVRQTLMLGASNCGNYLKWAFIRRCLDGCRTSGADEFRMIYRAMNRVCRESDRVLIQKNPAQPLRYSMTPDSLTIQPLVEEDIREIPFPHRLVPDDWLDRTTQKRFLLPLLQYFWESVCLLWNNQPVWVELRYPAHWLMRFVGPEGLREVYFPDDRTAVRLDAEDFQFDSPEEPFAFQFKDPAADARFDPNQIIGWASLFPNRLSDAEQAVFYLRHCIELELKEIAQKLQYSSASGPAYPLKCARKKLASFAADFPWISPDDLNPEAFSLFRDKLCAALKLMVSVP